jgi:hypothetical protein
LIPVGPGVAASSVSLPLPEIRLPTMRLSLLCTLPHYVACTLNALVKPNQ